MSVRDDPARMKNLQTRPDGWPLCPTCGEDELYSLAIQPTPETIVGCYRCGRWPAHDQPRLHQGGLPRDRPASDWEARGMREATTRSCHRRLRLHRWTWELREHHTGWCGLVCTRCGKRTGPIVPRIPTGRPER
jgi:hypothetical protein